MVNVTNTWDILCNLCILILENLCHITNLSYGFINIVLFVILGPLSTIMFMCSTLAHMIIKNQRLKKLWTWIFFAAGWIIILAIILPVIYATLTLPV